MAVPTQPLPTIGQPNSSEDPKIRSALSELQTVLTGGLDVTNVSTTTLQLLGLTNGSQIGRGKTNIAASETRTNVAFGTLTTPDTVTGIVLPTDGIIAVLYHALWQESVAGAARAAIFVGANQVKSHVAGSAGPVASAAERSENAGSFGPNIWTGLVSAPFGLFSTNITTADEVEITTGTAIAFTVPVSAQPKVDIGGNFVLQSSAYGGVCYIYAAAGTYDISVQYKASSGNVLAKNRHLWVWTLGF